MSRETITRYIDDLDKSELTEDQLRVVRFSVDGKDYMLDLSPENEQKFRETLKPFIEVAHRPANVQPSKVRPADVREWAQRNNRQVASRGKIPTEVVQAYIDATVGRRK